MEIIFYRDCTIVHDPKPIPTTEFDWTWHHNDFDGAPDSGDRRCGHCSTLAECEQEIDDLHNNADDVTVQAGSY